MYYYYYLNVAPGPAQRRSGPVEAEVEVENGIRSDQIHRITSRGSAQHGPFVAWRRVAWHRAQCSVDG